MSEKAAFNFLSIGFVIALAGLGFIHPGLFFVGFGAALMAIGLTALKDRCEKEKPQ